MCITVIMNIYHIQEKGWCNYYPPYAAVQVYCWYHTDPGNEIELQSMVATLGPTSVAVDAGGFQVGKFMTN